MSSSTSSTTLSSWQQAWENAQPQLLQMRDSLLSLPSPPQRVTRVGQLDAELLDQELVQLLKEPLVKALSLVNSGWKARFEPELVLLVQISLYKLSVWDTGASYGAKLQSLRYAAPGSAQASVPSSGLPRRVLVIHGILTILLPYFHTRLRAYALSHAWPDAPTSDRRRRAWELLSHLESMHGMLTLLNFVAFLWNGRYRTTVDRLLRLRLVAARRLAKREVSYEFMNRQMVWHAFTEFLLFLLPLINVRAVRRQIIVASSHLSPSSFLPTPLRSLLGIEGQSREGATKEIRRGPYWSLPSDQCAICAENASSTADLAGSADAINSVTTLTAYGNVRARAEDTQSDEPPTFSIHNPYITSCDHVYCYYCVSERMMRTADERSGVGPGGTQWECLRCGEGVLCVERLEAEAEGPEYESGVDDEDGDYGYGSEDMEFTDMSGSVGTYSESAFSE